MSRYRFALRPRWIVSHVFVGAMVVAMIVAGLWQLDRRSERQDRNAQVAARTEQPPADAASLAAPGDFDAVDELEFRRASATGTYLADDEVLVRSRTRDGAPGSWVLTPLDLGDGTAVVVNRGWIANSGQLQAVPTEARAPEGEVTVVGLVRATETRGSFGSQDPADGVLTDLARADVARLDQQVDADLLPFFVQALAQDPAPDAAGQPLFVPAPELDEGPHLSYAGQWFLFTAMTLIVYPLILRRRARELDREALARQLDAPDPADVVHPDDPRAAPTP